MGAGVAIQTLQLQGDFHQAAHRLVVIAHLLQLGLPIDRLLKRNGLGRIVRNQLRHPVHLEERQPQHAAHVAYGGAGLQLAEGDDLRHPVAAILSADVFDHLVATVLAEINVEVGHRHALGVQESLEQQPRSAAGPGP